MLTMSYRFFFKLTLCLAWVIGMGLIGMPTVKAGVLDDATEVKVIRKGQTLRFTSARQAVGLVSSQFGPQSVQWIAEMRGRRGIPQPSHWEILAFDERAPRLLYKFWAQCE